jgi:hypothetical protein
MRESYGLGVPFGVAIVEGAICVQRGYLVRTFIQVCQ